MAEAYRIGFYDRGKAKPKNHYFENPNAYDKLENTTVLRPFSDANADDDYTVEKSDSERDQVYLDNYNCSL